jgi:hypothetical protein
MIRSLLNFTGTWISISRGAFKFWNFQNGHYFKIATNIKIKKIVKNSKMKRFPRKWIFTGSKTCCTIWWIQNGRHSKPMMEVNSQHHNLLGNQISSKSEDFCILVAILDSKWSPYGLKRCIQVLEFSKWPLFQNGRQYKD